ncbi:hypothetical protein PGTUg99_016123 [Puccinia graminis f. sp. tritici]|uniref:Uncharacterized protein n=3 Tax=Puccinia graminis f. sp. tritici TaxID=56615 RepID=A0A5B0MQJ9_PUCGR|nr:hypothetical protein PGTUg99_016123 [Puccinia graminis f. sp. tritici]
MTSGDTTCRGSKLMLLILLSLLLSRGIASMMTSRYRFLYPPLDVNLSQTHDPQTTLALTLNQNARGAFIERTRIFNKIHSYDNQATEYHKHIGAHSDRSSSAEEQKLIDAWIFKVENDLITPIFEREFLVLHPLESDPQDTLGRRKVSTNYKHPFTVLYTLNARERILSIMLGLETGFEEASSIIECEIRQWGEELTKSHSTFPSVKLPLDPVDCQLFRLSLSDMVWFGLQRSSGGGEKLNFVEIAKAMSSLWLQHPNATGTYGPIDWAPSLTRPPPMTNEVPKLSRTRKIPQSLKYPDSFQDISSDRPGPEVSRGGMSSSSATKPTSVEDETSNEARESSIERLLNHFGWDAQLDFASHVMDSTWSNWDSGPSRTQESLPVWNNHDHSTNHIQSTVDANHFLEDGHINSIGIENSAYDPRFSPVSSTPSSNNGIPVPLPGSKHLLESQLHSILHQDGAHNLPFSNQGEPPRADQHEPGTSQHELLNPYSLPDWSEELEKFLFDD